MNKKILILTLFLLSLSFILTPALAQPPDIHIFVQPDERDIGIIVDRAHIEVQVLDYIIKSFTQERAIGKQTAGWASVRVSFRQRILDQDGKLLALIHTSMKYTGTMQIGDPPYITGVLVYNYQYIILDEVLILPPDLDKGHYTIWFEDGLVVDYRGHGMMVPPWIP